jgi:hypothetical protein
VLDDNPDAADAVRSFFLLRHNGTVGNRQDRRVLGRRDVETGVHAVVEARIARAAVAALGVGEERVGLRAGGVFWIHRDQAGLLQSRSRNPLNDARVGWKYFWEISRGLS